jgi:hypothetical protein
MSIRELSVSLPLHSRRSDGREIEKDLLVLGILFSHQPGIDPLIEAHP